jgi:hypothetical protein
MKKTEYSAESTLAFWSRRGIVSWSDQLAS